MFCNLFSFGGRGGIAAANVAFRAIDSDDRPICGAVYRLTCLCPCEKYIHAMTGRNGCVTFCGVCPGEYELTQREAPWGFEPDPAAHEVEVTKDGCVKIDGLPLRCFNSVNERIRAQGPEAPEAPEIDVTFTDSLTITGSGEPCCRVEVTFPGGACCCATVHRNGRWCVDVPCGTELPEGEEVCATIICDCKPRSETACEEIQAR